MNYNVLVKNKGQFNLPKNQSIEIITRSGLHVGDWNDQVVSVPVQNFTTNLMSFRAALDDYNRANRESGDILTIVTEGVDIYNLIKC